MNISFCEHNSYQQPFYALNFVFSSVKTLRVLSLCKLIFSYGVKRTRIKKLILLTNTFDPQLTYVCTFCNVLNVYAIAGAHAQCIPRSFTTARDIITNSGGIHISHSKHPLVYVHCTMYIIHINKLRCFSAYINDFSTYKIHHTPNIYFGISKQKYLYGI